MKEEQLRKHAKCSICGQPIGHTGLPLFWVISIERHGINMDAVRRQDGLGAVLGNTRLAQVLGTDAEMTVPMGEPVVVAVCETCAVGDICLAWLVERGEG